MSLTRDLGVFISRVVQEGTTQQARDAAKTGFIDSVATLIAGRSEPATTTLCTALSPLPPGPCSVGLSAVTTTDCQAALINGVAAHALDFDDVALRGHPSAVMVPAIIAVAQSLGSTGTQMLDAYIAGYEVWGNLVDRESDVHHIKGWHPTGIFGSIGAAAACAVLYRLDARQSRHALGLGATQSAGLMSNFGSMAKPLHAGHAAHAGVLAARLAAAGFTASDDALEHEQGFLAAVSPQGRVDRLYPANMLGQPWSIATRRMNIKKYPTCYYTHRALDALLTLLESRPIDPKHVQRVEVTMSREHATVLRNHRPQDALAAKFSIEFAMACALVAGKVGLVELNDSLVQSRAIQDLLPRVSVSFSDDYDPQTPAAAYADQVVVVTSGDVRFTSEPVHQASGHARRPLGLVELRTKFLDCLAYGGFQDDATKLFERLCSLEQFGAADLSMCRQ